MFQLVARFPGDAAVEGDVVAVGARRDAAGCYCKPGCCLSSSPGNARVPLSGLADYYV